MAAQLIPLTVYRATDNNGASLAGGQLWTYQAGTLNPQATYTDITQSVQNTNPVLLNARGEANIWLDASKVYKFALQDANGNPIWTVDNVQGLAQQIGQVLYPPNSAENTAGAVPVNLQYPYYTPDRYLTNAAPGTTDMWQGIFLADKAANIAGASVNFLPGFVYGINCTNHASALTISSSWVCNGPQATIRRLDFTASTPYFTAVAAQIAHLTLRGLIFDGQVTTVAAGNTPNQDIAAVGSYNDNGTESLWTQVYGVAFRQTQYCTVEQCVFKNFLRSGLRFDASVSSGPPASGLGAPWTFFAGGGQAQTGALTNMLSLGNRVVNCRTQRTRGVFGDGFYTENSENNVFVDCYAYDYQRIGFVLEIGNQTNNYGTNGGQYVNCTADFGHDGVTSAAQSNVGFWSESVDGLSMTNCESKNTSVGWVVGSAANNSLGTFRPYAGTQTFTGCRAIRCNSTGFKTSFASRDVHCVFQGCFAEVNSTAATYAYSVGAGANGFQIVATPGGSPPDGLTGVSYHIEIIDCHVDLVAMSGTSGGNPSFNAAAVHMWQCAVTNAQQLQVDIVGLSTKWLTAAGAMDPNVPGTYELTTGNNYGYFGDIIFTGQNNGGSRFQGKARIRDCVNQTTGYLMVSSEINSANSALEVSNCFVSFRTGGATSNLGTLNLNNCLLVDIRGNIVFSQIFATGCWFADADSGNKDRTFWGNATLGSTIFYFSNCRFQRQLDLTLGSGTATNRSQNAIFSNCEWFLQFPWSGGGEVPLQLLLASGAFAIVQLTGCSFRNVGGHSSANGSMILCATSTGTLQITGAGNAYDSNYVSTGGHVLQFNNTPTFNDAPQTVAGPWLSVNGVLTQWNNA